MLLVLWQNKFLSFFSWRLLFLKGFRAKTNPLSRKVNRNACRLLPGLKADAHAYILWLLAAKTESVLCTPRSKCILTANSKITLYEPK